jgi:hypothetical protein
MPPGKPHLAQGATVACLPRRERSVLCLSESASRARFPQPSRRRQGESVRARVAETEARRSGHRRPQTTTVGSGRKRPSRRSRVSTTAPRGFQSSRTRPLRRSARCRSRAILTSAGHSAPRVRPPLSIAARAATVRKPPPKYDGMAHAALSSTMSRSVGHGLAWPRTRAMTLCRRKLGRRVPCETTARATR